MGYCDFLYRPVNIIGYSGNIDQHPTVYFFRDARDANGEIKLKTVMEGNTQVSKVLFLHGHITQSHPVAKNVGRELVYESWSYSIANVDPSLIPGFSDPVQGKRLQETYHQSEVPADGKGFFATPDGFSDFHVSRSTFTQVGPRDEATIQKLANAIGQCPYVKPMYGKVADTYIKSR